jgi:hypothetical protein
LKAQAYQARHWAGKSQEFYQRQRQQFISAIDAGKEAYRSATGTTGEPNAGFTKAES